MLAARARGARRPSVLALTRQNLPQLRNGPATTRTCCARGAYEIAPADGEAEVTDLRHRLRRSRSRSRRASSSPSGRPARVVSVPCFELFGAPDDSRRAMIGDAPVKVAVEAGGPPGLGRDHRLRRRLRRHDRLRRQRAVQGPLQAFRHHRRGGRRAALKLGRQAITERRDFSSPPGDRAQQPIFEERRMGFRDQA